MTLRGEFDLSCHAALGAALEAALAREPKATVDLSGVTFLDSSCARELALLVALHGDRLVLGDTSREVEASVTACGMDDIIRFDRPRRAAKEGERRPGPPKTRGPENGRRALRR